MMARLSRKFAIIMPLAMAGVVSAQDAVRPGDEPVVPPASVGERPVIAPDDPVVLEAGKSDAASDPLGLGGAGRAHGGLIAEGTYLSRWTGRLVQPEEGLWVFAFDAAPQAGPGAAGSMGVTGGAAKSGAGPVMVMLPCLRLLEMQRLSRDRGGDLTFRVSGHVTIFEGRNYFLPRVVTTIADKTDEQPKPGDAAPAKVQGATADADPSIEALMARVRAAAPATEIALRTMPDEQGEERRLMTEGSMIMSKPGRAIRRSEGAIEFVVDNGAFGDGASDASAVLLPCLLTGEIARLVDERGDRVRFTISGEVLAYAGRTYLLPTLYRVEPNRSAGGLSPAQ